MHWQDSAMESIWTVRIVIKWVADLCDRIWIGRHREIAEQGNLFDNRRPGQPQSDGSQRCQVTLHRSSRVLFDALGWGHYQASGIHW